jgi:hypothetical protein
MEGLPTGGKVFGNLTCVSTFASVTIPEFTAQNGFIYRFIYDGNSVTADGIQSIEFYDNTLIDDINWQDDSNGTLTVVNNSTYYDIVLFADTLSIGNIIGGVRAGATVRKNISRLVNNFETGGSMTILGMRRSIYNQNKPNLSNAKVEYSAIIIYGEGKKYRAEINSALFGEYCFVTTNYNRIGIEIRKNSPNGEKIAYIPPFAVRRLVFTATSSRIHAFPVYVYYNNSSKKVSILSAEMTAYPFDPVDPELAVPYSFEFFTNGINISHSVAYITVINNVMNHDARLDDPDTGTIYPTQNGFDSVLPGESNTFEVASDYYGRIIHLNLLLNGNLYIPVREGEGYPVIRNGYDYTVTLNRIAPGFGQDQASNFSAVITEGAMRGDVGNIDW